MTHGAPDPIDLGAVRHTGNILDGLAGRRFRYSPPTCGVQPAAADDEAIRLLHALVADVDLGAPPLPRTQLPTSARVVRTIHADRRPRRSARALIGLGVAAAVLTTTGVAAANGLVDRINRVFEARDGSKSQPAQPRLRHMPRGTSDHVAGPAGTGSAPQPGDPASPTAAAGPSLPALPVGKGGNQLGIPPLKPERLVDKKKIQKFVKRSITKVLRDDGGPELGRSHPTWRSGSAQETGSPWNLVLEDLIQGR